MKLLMGFVTCKNLLLIKAALIALLNLSIIHWSLSKHRAKEQICIFWIESSACPWKGHLLKILIKQYCHFRWLHWKVGKLCLEWFWIDCNKSLQPNHLQMKCNVWKPCSDQHWHNLILKIVPKFQVISFYISEFNELLHEHWAKIVQSVECDNMYPSKVNCQEFWYTVFGFDIQLELS